MPGNSNWPQIQKGRKEKKKREKGRERGQRDGRKEGEELDLELKSPILPISASGISLLSRVKESFFWDFQHIYLEWD